MGNACKPNLVGIASPVLEILPPFCLPSKFWNTMWGQNLAN